MTDTKKKPTKRFSWGSLSIAEWENLGKDNTTFKTYTLSKNVYNAKTKQLENAGSISINRKEHFTNILYLLENATKTLQEQSRAGYNVKFTADDTNKIKECYLVKFYKDKNNEEKSQSIAITPIDMNYLKTLIRIFEDKMVYYFYEKTNRDNTSYTGSFENNADPSEANFVDVEPDYSTEPGIDDDIPF